MDEQLVQGIIEMFNLYEQPNTAKYIAIHGIGAVMSKYDLKAPFKTIEEVYAECIKQNVTWEELLDFKGYDGNKLL